MYLVDEFAPTSKKMNLIIQTDEVFPSKLLKVHFDPKSRHMTLMLHIKKIWHQCSRITYSLLINYKSHLITRESKQGLRSVLDHNLINEYIKPYN